MLHLQQKVNKLKKYYPVLLKSPLFHGILEKDLESMLSCLNARAAGYAGDSVVFLAGDPAARVGLVLEGAVQVVREDIFGNRAILTALMPGQLFGETFACAGVEILPVSVIAVSDCKILLLDYRRIITTCPTACVFHSRLIENMLKILAGKNLVLNQKIEALSARTTREKLLAYLVAQAGVAGSRRFTIPSTRQELADYLSVDRSALSREMGIMQKEGMIRFKKNCFELTW